MESTVGCENSFVEETLLRTEEKDATDASRGMNFTLPIGIDAYGSQHSVGEVKSPMKPDQKIVCIDESMDENCTESPSIMEATKLENGSVNLIFPQVSSTPLRSGSFLKETNTLNKINDPGNEVPDSPLVSSVLNNSIEAGTVFDTTGKYNLSDFWESMADENPMPCEALDALTVVDSIMNYSVISCDNVTLLFDALEVPLMSTSKQLPPNTPHEKQIVGVPKLKSQLASKIEYFDPENSFDQNFTFSQPESKLSELKTRSDFYTLAFINSFSETDQFSNISVPPSDRAHLLPHKNLVDKLSSNEDLKALMTNIEESKVLDTELKLPLKASSSAETQTDNGRGDSLLYKPDVSNNLSLTSPMQCFISQLHCEDPTVFNESKLKSDSERSFSRLPVFTAITEEFSGSSGKKVSSDGKLAENCQANLKTGDIMDLSVSLACSDLTLENGTLLDVEDVSGLMLDNDSEYYRGNISMDFKPERSLELSKPTYKSSSDQISKSIPAEEKHVSEELNVSLGPHSPLSMVAVNRDSLEECKEKLKLYEEFSLNCQSALSSMKQDIYALQDNIFTLTDRNNSLSNKISFLEENNECLKDERDNLFSKLKQYETGNIEKQDNESVSKEKDDMSCSQNDTNTEIYERKLKEYELVVLALKDELDSLRSKMNNSDVLDKKLKEVSDELSLLRQRYSLVEAERDNLLSKVKKYEAEIVEKENQEILWKEKYAHLFSQSETQMEIHANKLREKEQSVLSLTDELNSLRLKINDSDVLHQRFKEVWDELSQLSHRYSLVLAERDNLSSKLEQYESEMIEIKANESEWKEKYEIVCSQREIDASKSRENELALKDEITSLRSKINDDDGLHQKFKEVKDELSQISHSFSLTKAAFEKLTDENAKLKSFRTEVKKLMFSKPDCSSDDIVKEIIDLVGKVEMLKARDVDSRMLLTEIGEVNKELLSVFFSFFEKLNNTLSLDHSSSDCAKSEYFNVLGSILVMLNSFHTLKIEDLFFKMNNLNFFEKDVLVIDSKVNYNISPMLDLINKKMCDLEQFENSYSELKANYNSLIEKLMTCFDVKTFSSDDILQCIENQTAELKMCRRELDAEKEKNSLYNNLKLECKSMLNRIDELEAANCQLNVDLRSKVNEYEKLSSELAEIEIQREKNQLLYEERAKQISLHCSEIDSLKKLISKLKEESQKSRSKIFSIVNEPSLSFDEAIKILHKKNSSYQDLHENLEWTKSKLQELDNECEDLTAKNRLLEQGLIEAAKAETAVETRFKEELAKEKEINSDLCRENFRLKVSLKDVADKNKELEESLLDLNKKISTNQKMQDNSSGSVEELKAEIIDKNSKITLMKVQLMRLEEDFEHRGQTVENYRRKVSELKMELKSMEQKLEKADESKLKEQLARQPVMDVKPVVKPKTVDVSVQVHNQNTTALPSNFVHACKIIELNRKIEKLTNANSSLKKALMKKEESQKQMRSVFQDVTNN